MQLMWKSNYFWLSLSVLQYLWVRRMERWSERLWYELPPSPQPWISRLVPSGVWPIREILLWIKHFYANQNSVFRWLHNQQVNNKNYTEFTRAKWSLNYWVTQKLPQICTVILRIRNGKVAWFAVYICGNFWVAQYNIVA